jgi:hypothetical protein
MEWYEEEDGCVSDYGVISESDVSWARATYGISPSERSSDCGTIGSERSRRRSTIKATILTSNSRGTVVNGEDDASFENVACNQSYASSKKGNFGNQWPPSLVLTVDDTRPVSVNHTDDCSKPPKVKAVLEHTRLERKDPFRWSQARIFDITLGDSGSENGSLKSEAVAEFSDVPTPSYTNKRESLNRFSLTLSVGTLSGTGEDTAQQVAHDKPHTVWSNVTGGRASVSGLNNDTVDLKMEHKVGDCSVSNHRINNAGRHKGHTTGRNTSKPSGGAWQRATECSASESCSETETSTVGSNSADEFWPKSKNNSDNDSDPSAYEDPNAGTAVTEEKHEAHMNKTMFWPKANDYSPGDSDSEYGRLQRKDCSYNLRGGICEVNACECGSQGRAMLRESNGPWLYCQDEQYGSDCSSEERTPTALSAVPWSAVLEWRTGETVTARDRTNGISPCSEIAGIEAGFEERPGDETLTTDSSASWHSGEKTTVSKETYLKNEETHNIFKSSNKNWYNLTYFISDSECDAGGDDLQWDTFPLSRSAQGKPRAEHTKTTSPESNMQMMEKITNNASCMSVVAAGSECESGGAEDDAKNNDRSGRTKRYVVSSAVHHFNTGRM